MKNSNHQIVGLKQLRENINIYINAVEKGKSFVVVRKSKPVFKISSVEEADELWERVADFTTIKQNGVSAKEILKIIRQLNA
jgi:prevent-host-death family protein